MVSRLSSGANLLSPIRVWRWMESPGSNYNLGAQPLNQ